MFDRLFSLISYDIGIDLGTPYSLTVHLIRLWRDAVHGAALTGRAVAGGIYA